MSKLTLFSDPIITALCFLTLAACVAYHDRIRK